MWLWVFRILFSAAFIYCAVKSSRLLEQARFHAVRPMTQDEFSWQMTDKLLTDEGKILASEGRMWAIPAYVLGIVCGVLWICMKN